MNTTKEKFLSETVSFCIKINNDEIQRKEKGGYKLSQPNNKAKKEHL